jgi:hypothetical protein
MLSFKIGDSAFNKSIFNFSKKVDNGKVVHCIFQEDVETQTLITNKQFDVMTQFDVGKILDLKLDKIIMEHYLTAKPRGDFF